MFTIWSKPERVVTVRLCSGLPDTSEVITEMTDWTFRSRLIDSGLAGLLEIRGWYQFSFFEARVRRAK